MKKVEVLGMGCPKCQATLKNVEEALQRLGIEAEVSKVEDLTEIVFRGVMVTPALVIDGEIKVSGRVPSVPEIGALL
ncbi:MAG: thioredoxin family protein [Candidatus Bipolaricaulota bacterium]|nr:thioredoxin family protein [Candidatus Bipolaricaulota bacterium]